MVCLSDTYGLDANNGVGRFLHDLRGLAAKGDLPLKIIACATGKETQGVHLIKAPSFTLPGYSDLRISMPLEHHRKSLLHELKAWRPDVLHVSTPGPLGCFGVTLAKELRLPLVGIYHTDFSSYAREVVRSQLVSWRDNPARVIESLSKSLHSFGQFWLPYLNELRAVNERLDDDVASLMNIARRNCSAATANAAPIELAGQLAHTWIAKALKRFYSYFTLVVARSLSQEGHLRTTIGVDKERIRCLVPGTDVEQFHPRLRDRCVWNDLAVPKDAFIALYVGRANSEKNFEFLLDVWRQARGANQESARFRADALACDSPRLVIVGRGDESLLRRAKELPGVHVLGAHRGELLSRLYASADVCLFPSVTETLGQVGLEAGASGLPLIAADEGGPRTYVLPGETGFLLSTRDPAEWARKLLQLMADERLRRRLSTRAREHIAREHTLEASLRSYWQIHEEAVELASRGRLTATRRVACVGAARSESPASNMSSEPPGLLVITDYHAGKRFGTRKHKAQKEAALEKMLQHADDHDLDVVFGGDFGDHGAKRERALADFAAIRRVRERVGLRVTPVFVRGNHDYGYADQQLAELVGGCKVHHSLAYTHEPSRVTVTHGHVLGLHRVAELIRTMPDRQAIEHALREDVLDEELKPSIIAYDLANLVESYTRQMGLTGLGAFWEGLFKTRGRLAEALFAWGERANQKDERTWKLIASLIGSHNDIETAGWLGAACGSWATVFGHTHEPLAEAVTLARESTSSPRQHLVGNAGNMNRKRPSCIIARFPELRLYCYKHETRALRMSHRARLEDSAAVQIRTASSESCRAAATQSSQFTGLQRF